MATPEQIAAIYQRELGRAPDPGGLDFYTGLAKAGTSLNEIARQISGSPEGTQFDPSGAVTFQAPTLGSTINQQAAGTNVTPGQAQMLKQAYDSGDMQKVQNLVNTFGVKASDVQAYFPGFDTSTLAGQGINLVGSQPQFNMNDYLSRVQDMYTQAARASAESNLRGAQTATAANRVNQITPFGNVQYTQSGTDSQGNPIWTATQTLPQGLEGAYQGILGNVSNQYAQPFKPNLPSVGINPGEQYEQAILRRLEPVQARQRESLEVDLANQGIMPGSEAYNRAKSQLAQAQNDQLTSAVVGGFNTGLAANQQAFNQGLTSYQLPMATLNQLRTGAQPSFVTPSTQATVAGPDYLGAYTANQNYQLGLQNAQSASNANMMGGLFGLGSAALLNPTGVSQIFSGIGSGLSKAYNSIFG